MRERAYAKINLCLDVVRKREDGFHELRMIMVPVEFYDMLEINPAEETTMSLNRYYLPVNEKNTVIKAIRILQQKYGFTQNFECVLQKHIPTQAGLAGGSADAAAAIRMINRIMHLNMREKDMIEVAEQVGSDVPFCTLNKPALVEGTGEKLQPFSCHPDFGILLVKPRKGVSTRLAFSGLNFEHILHPDVDAMKDALVQNDYDAIVKNLGNSLEEVSMNLVPEIAQIKADLLASGFDGALMSGSGSTVFGITKSPRVLKEGKDLMSYNGYFTRMTRVLPQN